MRKLFVFFHVGDDVAIPTMLVDSIRWSNPDAGIIFCTDLETPEIRGVDQRVEVVGDRSRLMTYRLKAFASCGLDEPAMYLDTDMLMVKPVNPATLLGTSRIAMCRRSFNIQTPFNGRFRNLDFLEYDRQPMGDVYPFLACCTVTRDAKIWGELLEILSGLDEKFHLWYGDQEALKIFARDVAYDRRSELSFLPESVFGCLPEEGDFVPNAAIIHFKGARKSALAPAYKQILKT
jgi:hypothetical protein